MRQFELINELGQSFGLNSVQKGFLHEPKGFGYELDHSFAKMGTVWKQMYLKDTQSTITANVLFGTTSPYEAQTEFLAFVRTSKKLSLKRTTPAGTHLKDVVVVSYEINEIGEGNMLQCPITMVGTTLWYTNYSQRATIDTSSGNEVRYSYTFPSVFNDYSEGKLTINNDGSTEAAFTAEMYGAIANPVISIYVNGAEVSKIEIPETVSSGSKIIYSSVDGDLYCFSGTDAQIDAFKRTGSTTGLTNIVYDLSLGNTNFFKIPVGTSELHVTADSAITNPVVITIYKYFRAV